MRLPKAALTVSEFFAVTDPLPDEERWKPIGGDNSGGELAGSLEGLRRTFAAALGHEPDSLARHSSLMRPHPDARIVRGRALRRHAARATRAAP